MTDWKKVASSAALVVGALLYFAVAPLLDGDALTVPNWGAVGTAVAGGFGIQFLGKSPPPAAPSGTGAHAAA